VSGDAAPPADTATSVATATPVDTARPALRIVRGNPTAEEIAALTAVVTATASAGGDPPPPPQRGRWNDPAHQHRRPLRSGPGGWRAAAR
jgi:hypothetical protein